MAAQPFPAQVAMQPGHPGMQHGHPIPGGQHPGAHMGGHPGAGMMQGMHPGVSGPQVTGPMVTGMPPGPGTPAPGGPIQAHAMAHLGPAQQAMFQQHNPQMNFGIHPQAAHQNNMARQRQNMLQAQQAQQAQLGIPVSMPNAPGPNQAQLAQMRANAQTAGVNISMQQQIQLMQAQAQQQQQQQQQQQPHNMQQAQQQHQMIQVQQQAQQLAMHAQQRHAHAQAAQQMQHSHSQEANTQPPRSQSTPAPQPPPQMQQPPSLQQQPQQPPQGPSPGQNANNQQQQPPPPPPPPSQGQTMPQQTTQQMAHQDALSKAAAYSNMQRNIQEMPKSIKGLSILRLVSYQDHLGNPERPGELDYWESFVANFFSPEGVLRQQVWSNKNKGDKTYRIEYPSLPRFYLAHFTGGIDQIWMSVLGASEKDFAHVGHHTVWSGMASTKYAYKNGNVVVTMGQVKVNFDSENRIELLDIATNNWKEYIPREMVLPPKSPPDQKESPKLNKNLKRPQPKPAPSPPSATIPDSRVNEYGVPKPLMQYLEMAEVFSTMTPLIQYSQSHPTITPQQALEKMVHENTMRASQMASMAQGNLNAPIPMAGQRTPGLNGASQFASPALAHLGLPTGQGSPHLSGPGHTPSPAQNHMAGPVAMVHQQSQQGSNLSGSQVTSANTSPSVQNKRRRASAVKLEDDGGGVEVNGTGANRVRPSPKIGGKRHKGTA